MKRPERPMLAAVLRSLDACDGPGEAVPWSRKYSRDWYRAWLECERGDWMLWLLERLPGAASRDALVSISRAAALRALRVYAPAALDRAGLTEHAVRLRALPDDCDLEAAARAAWKAAAAAWKAARAEAEAEATWKAAEATWKAAEAAKAARAAWKAATAAARAREAATAAARAREAAVAAAAAVEAAAEAAAAVEAAAEAAWAREAAAEAAWEAGAAEAEELRLQADDVRRYVRYRDVVAALADEEEKSGARRSKRGRA